VTRKADIAVVIRKFTALEKLGDLTARLTILPRLSPSGDRSSPIMASDARVRIAFLKTLKV
jgi:hypothetical protein